MALNSTTSIQSEFPEISQEELDSIKISPEVKEHYSQENELKRLLIERTTYKKAYEKQQEKIDNYIREWNNMMSSPVVIKTNTKTTIKTLRDILQREYFNHAFSVRYNFKILDEIKYYGF